MSGHLSWDFTSGKPDRRARQAFICTSPAKAKWNGSVEFHPRIWELEVPTTLKMHGCKPAERLLIGCDDEGIGAMCLWREEDGPGDVFLMAAAVAMRFRRAGGGCANEMVQNALIRIIDRATAVDLHAVSLSTKIHVNNDASQRLARRHGFSPGEMDGDHSFWVVRINF